MHEVGDEMAKKLMEEALDPREVRRRRTSQWLGQWEIEYRECRFTKHTDTISKFVS